MSIEIQARKAGLKFEDDPDFDDFYMPLDEEPEDDEPLSMLITENGEDLDED